MIGKTLIHYEITSQLGKGGMGEVYQAKDTKLGRDVAIKILPEEFARDADRVARFQREAKLLASLNHPNIAAIYGLEEADGTNFLVMELIEGDTLADRIKKGPTPVEDALKLALQIAEALEAAHEKGIIHRDLKPANIKITPEGKVKVLDFGLAKAFTEEEGKEKPLDSPTLSDAATRQGIILGTAAYMSPEQARGKPVDKRSDIWAFGVILFEMLTGKHLFAGEDTTSTLARVLERDPDYSTLTPNLHPRIRFLLERCLEKDARNRYSSIGDARVEIQKVLADPSGVFVQPGVVFERHKRTGTTLTWAAVVVLTAIIVGAVIWTLRKPEPKQVIRLSHELPSGQQFNNLNGAYTLAVSPDGKQFVYSTPKGLYLRSVNELDAKLIAGTEDNDNPMMPFFSYDGKWIGYWSATSSQLKKISVNGGAPVVLCETGIFGGGSWCEDNTIVYGQISGEVMRVSGDGGTPESIVKEPGMVTQPQILANGKAVIYTDYSVSPARIKVYSFESGEGKELFPGTFAIYLSTGHLVYSLANNNIFAVPFDIDKLEATGGPVPLEEGALEFVLSKSGTLVYIPRMSGGGSTPLRTLVWVDKGGNEEQIEAEPNIYHMPKISPDGTKVALAVEKSGNTDIWIYDLSYKTTERLTFHDGADSSPVWTPDNKRIIFRSVRESGGIYSKAADGTGEVELIASDSKGWGFPRSLSGNGSMLAVQQVLSMTKIDIGTVSMEDDHTFKSLLHEDYAEAHPQISPDGKWLVYCSNETGVVGGIYVRPFPDISKGKWQISADGGNSPLWSPDGRELFYLIGNNPVEAVMRVAVQTKPTFKKGIPEELFRGTYVGFYPGDFTWDIHPDGKRFLMFKAPSTANAPTVEQQPKIIIVTNWIEELKQRVPVD